MAARLRAFDTLGGFEHGVLLAALHLRAEAYTSAIVMELESRIERGVSAAAVYIALRRLEEAGLVDSARPWAWRGGAS